jgi:hypothetical protein
VLLHAGESSTFPSIHDSRPSLATGQASGGNRHLYPPPPSRPSPARYVSPAQAGMFVSGRLPFRLARKAAIIRDGSTMLRWVWPKSCQATPCAPRGADESTEATLRLRFRGGGAAGHAESAFPMAQTRRINPRPTTERRGFGTQRADGSDVTNLSDPLKGVLPRFLSSLQSVAAILTRPRLSSSASSFLRG